MDARVWWRTGYDQGRRRLPGQFKEKKRKRAGYDMRETAADRDAEVLVSKGGKGGVVGGYG